jgi:2-polyprenyl-3-methyl-5-hydroxy-6-metoxy-1,4-benzoquinol methylase
MEEIEKCLLCNSIDYFEYCKIEGGKYKVMICTNCSLTKLSPLPTIEELNLFYTREYREKYSNQDIVTQDVIAYEQLRADRVIEVIKDFFNQDFKNILDIGCSSGTLLKNISKLAIDIVPYGIEMNDNYRKYVVENGIASAEHIFNNDINLYYNGNEEKFDFISIVHVLEHLHNPRLTLQSIYKLLSEEGILYIEVPNLKTPYNSLTKEYFAIYHLYYFTEYTLKVLLQSEGFEILKEKQIANTSICFVCRKYISNNVKIGNDNESSRLIKILKKYEKKYPLIKLRQIIIKVLDILRIKDLVKRMIK